MSASFSVQSGLSQWLAHTLLQQTLTQAQYSRTKAERVEGLLGYGQHGYDNYLRNRTGRPNSSMLVASSGHDASEGANTGNDLNKPTNDKPTTLLTLIN